MSPETTPRPITPTAVARYLTPRILRELAGYAYYRDTAGAKIAKAAANGSETAKRGVAKMALEGKWDISLNAMPVETRQTGLEGYAYRIERGSLVVYPTPTEGCPEVYAPASLRVRD